MFLVSTHSGMVGLLWAMGVRPEPSLIHTLPSACGLISLLDEVWTPPGQCTQSPVSAHTPRLVPVVSVPSEMRCRHSPVGVHPPWMGRWPGGEKTGAVAAGEFPKVPLRVFFFWGKSC